MNTKCVNISREKEVRIVLAWLGVAGAAIGLFFAVEKAIKLSTKA